MAEITKPFYTEFSNFVNSHCNRDVVDAGKASINDHLTLVQAKMRFCMAFIEALANAPYVDLRNEASVKLAKKIMASTDLVDRALPLI